MGRCPDDPTHLPAPVMQAHSCFKKACMIAALGHVRILPTDQRRDFALDPQTLASAMQASHVLIGRVMPPPNPPLLRTRGLRDPRSVSFATTVFFQEDVAAGLIPFYVLSTIGTTSSCAVDPIADVANVAHR